MEGDKTRILIDADGCPVVDEAIQAAAKHRLECVIVCDTAHEFRKQGARTVTVSKGADSADFALVNLVQSGDVVITQDYGLAAMCLARGAHPLNQDGLAYTDDNISALLMARHTARVVRQSGGRLRGPAKRRSAQDASFVRALEGLLQGLLGEAQPG